MPKRIDILPSRKISAMHLLSELQSLKNICYIPTAFNPSTTNNYEVYLGSLVLEYLETKTFNRNDLEHLAYISFLLNTVLTIDINKQYTFSFEAIPGLPRTSSLEALQNYILGTTSEMPNDDVIMRKLSTPEMHIVPNAIKALYLIQFSTLVVLPNILKRLSSNEEVSFKQQQATIIEYYNHIANHFIPQISLALSKEKIFGNLRVLGQLNKLLINFPTVLYPSIKEYIKNINTFTLNNLPKLTLYEIMSTVKLNEYAEICHAETFLTEQNKILLIQSIINKSQVRADNYTEMLMAMQYTIFVAQREHLQSFAKRFTTCWLNKQIDFDLKEQSNYYEEVIFKSLAKYIAPDHLNNFQRNYICPFTCKEIDLVYISEGTDKIRIAINIDGKDHHCYPGQERANRKTQVRNRSLNNAGWIVICQEIPRITQDFKEEISHCFAEEVVMLLIKLAPYLKVNIMLAILNETSTVSKSMIFKSRNDMDSEYQSLKPLNKI